MKSSDGKMSRLRGKRGFICDMDGVIYHGNRLLPGAKGIRGLVAGKQQTLPLFDELQRTLSQGVATKAIPHADRITCSELLHFVGKPNPLIMRHALKQLDCQREETVIIGDRMDTDILSGLEAEIEPVLVLSGVTAVEDLRQFPYSPYYVLDGVGDIPNGA